ncbi:hydrogenase expression/formation protein HypE [Candidatus Magnetomonas plexicatena]|uniref:hydrogenase expression/formation protein HypE n=1 Tax=Candidatus Magnetomonas plexicatena TaxID=2552947 RepID=UPI004032939A
MDRILLGAGGGGKLMHELIEKYFVPAFDLGQMMDSAILNIKPGKLAFTTDSFVVSPLFFAGGDIGSLAVNGTVNDLSVSGAEPLYLSAAFIIEEGFLLSDLATIVESMSKAAAKANVKVVTGDTKVVGRGKADRIFINTTGIGLLPDGVESSPLKIDTSDVIIVSGEIGNHGACIMSGRNGLSFTPPLLTDTRPLNGLIKEMLTCSKNIHFMRDPTRGGIATALKEAALASNKCIVIKEHLLPIADQVRGLCDLLGLDPLYIANEGILIAIVDRKDADKLLETMKKHPYGGNSAIIGEVMSSPQGMVIVETALGGKRVVEMQTHDQLPRIC